MTYITQHRIVRGSVLTSAQRSKWGSKDWAAALLIFTMVYTIPPMLFLKWVGLSPSYVLVGILLYLVRSGHRQYGRDLKKNLLLKVLALLYVIMGFQAFFFEGISLESLRFLLRYGMSFVGLYALAIYSLLGPLYLRRTAAVLVLALLISHTWYAFELTMGEPIISMRQTIYADVYYDMLERGQQWMNIRTGLTPYLHQMGYGSSVLLPLLLASLLSHRRKSIRVLSALALPLAGVLILLSTQRSAIFAAMLGIVLLLRHRSRQPQYLPWPVIFTASIATVALLYSLIVQVVETEYTVDEKMFYGAGLGDMGLRLGMQWRALILIMQNPLGLPFSGVSWAEEGFWAAYEAFQGDLMTAPTAQGVHNGYLGSALQFGALFLLICILFLVFFTRTCVRVLRRASIDGPMDVGAPIAASALGLFLVQAMFHNASILTREPVSLIMCALVVTLDLSQTRISSNLNASVA